jgi:nicotinamide-nucleotide amidase
MTRQGVAAATDRGLTFHQYLLDKIAERFAGFRAQMTENNRRQAYLPDDSIVIENPVGTAPSFIVEHEDRVVISLPGVPREMKYLMTEAVIPYLKERFNLGTGIIKARVLRTAGIGESMLDAQIGSELLQQSNPTVGLAAHSGQVDVRITAKANSETEADMMIAEVELQLRTRIGEYIFGLNTQKIEDVLVETLTTHHQKLTISETGIATPISQIIHATSSGQSVATSVLSYSTPVDLRRTLAVSDDLPIRELAEQAAEAAAKHGNTEAGIAVVSQPEMDEYHADAEGGTAIAVYFDGKTRSRVYGFGAQSDVAVDWVRTWSMSTLWRMMREKFNDQQMS